MNLSSARVPRIGAVVLAAGVSRRMGRPKMTLAWGATTVIGQVVGVLSEAGLNDIVVVTGGARLAVEDALRGTRAQAVYNPSFQQDNMVTSLQTGLRALGGTVEAALVALGDQPQIEAAVVRGVIAAYREGGKKLAAPSYKMRRGHPWLVARSLWEDVFAIQPGKTLRDFLNLHAAEIDYLEVVTPSILADLDTPEDYDRERPGGP